MMNFIKDIALQIKNIDSKDRQMRQFGLLMSIVLAIIVIYLYFSRQGYISWILIAMTIASVMGILKPRLLYWPYKIWMGLAVIAGFFISRIVLAVLFFILITPIGLIMRAIKGDFLHQKIDKDGESYWIKREDGYVDQAKLERLY